MNIKTQIHKERTLVIIKTDAVQRSLIGEIIKRFEQVGLKLTAAKLASPQAEQLEKHYNKTDEWFLNVGSGIVRTLKDRGEPIKKEPIEYGRDIIRDIVKYMTESPLMVLVFEGAYAVKSVVKLVGSTEPATADIGTIRGDYTIDSFTHANVENRAVKNLIHCSDCVEEAEREIKLWFTRHLKFMTTSPPTRELCTRLSSNPDSDFEEPEL